MRVGDLPTVFLSYDEPWADELWDDLKAKAPRPRRVHGVAGLDASHKAAAEAAGERWFVTVDADTRVDAAFFDQELDEDLLGDHLRLDWFSRSAVNGLVSGNGCLKLWPRALVLAMRTHEAAPADRISIDHEIAQIDPPYSMQVQLPGCFSTTDPARTPYHAFRAGFRESVYLAGLTRGTAGAADPLPPPAPAAAWFLRIWCSVGSHARNGMWVLYGARLGLWMRHRAPDWSVRRVNDYGWLSGFWATTVLPRFAPAVPPRSASDARWDDARLEAEVAALGTWINGTIELEVADLAPEESRLVAEAGILPAVRSGKMVDALGSAFLKGRGVPRDSARARELFEAAAAMGDPAAFNNLARMHERGTLSAADPAEAERLYEIAISLGNPHAPFHLAGMTRKSAKTADQRARVDALVRLAAERGYSPGDGQAAKDGATPEPG